MENFEEVKKTFGEILPLVEQAAEIANQNPDFLCRCAAAVLYAVCSTLNDPRSLLELTPILQEFSGRQLERMRAEADAEKKLVEKSALFQE